MRISEPLSPDFEADIDKYLPLIQAAWNQASGHGLAQWQVDILRRATELYPSDHKRAGELRFRQYFTSLARQNGKSELCAAFSLYALLREPQTATVVGIARSVDTANIVYERIASIIRLVPALKSRFKKVTETRGLQLLSGGKYQMKAGTGKALQGIPVSAGLSDELHLLPAEAWDALVAGTGGRPRTLVFGITTAGSDDSELLLRLYELASKAERGELDRFGFTIYESPVAVIPDDDELLAEYIRAANPAVAAGYKDVEAVISDVRTMPASEAVRFVLNRFVASSSGYMEGSVWGKCASVRPRPEGRAVISFDRTNSQSFASVAAATKAEDGRIYTELVAWPLRPTLDQLEAMAVALWQSGRVERFVMDGLSLGDLARRLTERGYPVTQIRASDVYQAPATFFAKVSRGLVQHPGDPLLSYQVPRAATKHKDDKFRIVKGPSGTDIDALIATVNAVYIAETHKDYGLQIS